MKDGRFETQAEIYQALLDGKKIQYKDGEIVFLENGKAMTLLCGELDNCSWSFRYPQEWSIYEEPKPKKKVTLYRYTYERSHSVTEQSVWITLDWTTYREFNLPSAKLLITESKEVEYDDV